MKMKWKQTVVTCRQLWCVARPVLVPVTCQMSFHPVHWLPNLSKVCPQLHRRRFSFLPLRLQQKISFLLLTSLHGAVKKSAVALYSGVLMVRSLLTPSFWILFAPVHAVHGPLWPLAIQRVYSKLGNEKFSNTESNIHYFILSTTEVFYLFSFLSFSAHHNSCFGITWKVNQIQTTVHYHLRTDFFTSYMIWFFLAFLYVSYSYTYFEIFCFWQKLCIYSTKKKIPNYSITLYILSFFKMLISQSNQKKFFPTVMRKKNIKTIIQSEE